MKIKCSISYDTETNDYGRDSDCVTATCSRCDHKTMSWGHSEASIKRCLVLMREECPNAERNFYVQ